MFEDGARIDDILNALRKPTLDDESKKDGRTSDAALRYESKQTPGDDVIKFDFAGQMNSGVLK